MLPWQHLGEALRTEGQCLLRPQVVPEDPEVLQGSGGRGLVSRSRGRSLLPEGVRVLRVYGVQRGDPEVLRGRASLPEGGHLLRPRVLQRRPDLHERGL